MVNYQNSKIQKLSRVDKNPNPKLWIQFNWHNIYTFIE